MMRRVVLVHTVAGLMPVFQELAKGLPGDVKISNIVDESLLEDAIAAGGAHTICESSGGGPHPVGCGQWSRGSSCHVFLDRTCGGDRLATGRRTGSADR